MLARNSVFRSVPSAETHREVSAVERMDHKRLVVDVNHTADSVAGSKRGQSTGIVFDDSMIVAVLDFLVCPLG